MKYLILIIGICTALNAFAGGRVNPFNGKPITYSLSEMNAREAMGAGAYDRMRMGQWSLQHPRGMPHRFSRHRYQFGEGQFDMDMKRAGETILYGLTAAADGTAYGATYMFGDEYDATAAWTTGAAYDTSDWVNGAYNTVENGLVEFAQEDSPEGYIEHAWRWSMKKLWKQTFAKW